MVAIGASGLKIQRAPSAENYCRERRLENFKQQLFNEEIVVDMARRGSSAENLPYFLIHDIIGNLADIRAHPFKIFIDVVFGNAHNVYNGPLWGSFAKGAKRLETGFRLPTVVSVTAYKLFDAHDTTPMSSIGKGGRVLDDLMPVLQRFCLSGQLGKKKNARTARRVNTAE
jgi:hypothetical protein